MKRKDLIQLVVFISVIGLIYATGYQAEVFGFVQRGLIKTGIVNANVEQDIHKTADYNWKLQSTDGKIADFADFKGKVVFINFWATWCPPCVAEMPEIHNLYKEIDSDKIAFVMISLDENPEKLTKFLERKEYTFPVYQLASGLPQVYESSSIPTTFVLSPDGKIVFEKQGIAGYNTESFKKMLNNLAGQTGKE